MSAEKNYKLRNAVELSTVVAYPFEPGKSLNHFMKEVNFSEHSIPLRHPVPGCFTGLYGVQDKQIGLGDAREYCDRNGYDMAVLDFWVSMDLPVYSEIYTFERAEITQLMRMERVSPDVMDFIVTNWKKWLAEDGKDVSVMGDGYFENPAKFVSDRSDLVARIFELFPKLRVIVHPAVPMFSSDPIKVATFIYPPAADGSPRVTRARIRCDDIPVVGV